MGDGRWRLFDWEEGIEREEESVMQRGGLQCRSEGLEDSPEGRCWI